MKKLLTLCLIAGATFTSCQKEPTASITSDKKEVEIGETITFDNTSADAVSYKQDFGDAKTSTEKAPKKTYEKAGSYTVKMVAYSKKEKKNDEATLSVKVKEMNEKFAGNWISNSNTGCEVGSMIISVSGVSGLNINLDNDLYTGTVLTATTAVVNIPTTQDADFIYTYDTKLSISGNTVTFTLNLSLYSFADGQTYYSTCVSYFTK